MQLDEWTKRKVRRVFGNDGMMQRRQRRGRTLSCPIIGVLKPAVDSKQQSVAPHFITKE